MDGLRVHEETPDNPTIEVIHTKRGQALKESLKSPKQPKKLYGVQKKVATQERDNGQMRHYN